MSGESTTTEYYVEPIDEQPLIGRRALDDSELDITPMIDITFLLLIFFLVAARLDQDTPVELPPARHGTAVSLKSSVILTVAAGKGTTADVFTGDGKSADRRLDSADLDAQAAAITAYVEEQLSSGDEKSNVLIKAEKGVRHRDVARVTAAVGKASFANKTDGELYVAVLEVQ